MDERKFKAMLILHGETMGSISQKLGVSASTMSAKIRDTTKLTRREIAIIIKEWDLTAADTISIFFGDVFPNV